jgi:hypothetical protein
MSTNFGIDSSLPAHTPSLVKRLIACERHLRQTRSTIERVTAVIDLTDSWDLLRRDEEKGAQP